MQLKIAAAKFLQLTAIKLQKLQLKIAAAKQFLQLIAINWSASLVHPRHRFPHPQFPILLAFQSAKPNL